jgi:flagellar biosynthetic protein FliP
MRSALWFIAILFASQVTMAAPVTLDIGEVGGISSRVIQMLALISVLSLAPSIVIMVTSFTRIVVVLSFLRSALGLQQTPPNPVLVSLALFLTAFIMMPTFEASYEAGIAPLMEERMTEKEAFPLIIKPFAKFMHAHTRPKDIMLFMQIANKDEVKTQEEIPLQVLVPAFMISELKRAFEIGFLIFLPFLIIDMMVASILMAMGMMMLPPVTISLPFKLIFFAMVDGWYLICGSLVKSYIGG